MNLEAAGPIRTSLLKSSAKMTTAKTKQKSAARNRGNRDFITNWRTQLEKRIETHASSSVEKSLRKSRNAGSSVTLHSMDFFSAYRQSGSDFLPSCVHQIFL